MDSMKSRLDFANVGDSAATVFRSGEAPSFTSDTDQAKDLNDSETTDTSSEIVLLNDIHNTNNEVSKLFISIHQNLNHFCLK